MCKSSKGKNVRARKGIIFFSCFVLDVTAEVIKCQMCVQRIIRYQIAIFMCWQFEAGSSCFQVFRPFSEFYFGNLLSICYFYIDSYKKNFWIKMTENENDFVRRHLAHCVYSAISFKQSICCELSHSSSVNVYYFWQPPTSFHKFLSTTDKRLKFSEFFL